MGRAALMCPNSRLVLDARGVVVLVLVNAAWAPTSCSHSVHAPAPLPTSRLASSSAAALIICWSQISCAVTVVHRGQVSIGDRIVTKAHCPR